MYARQGPLPDRIIIFCRYPVPGRSKTRLIPALGPVGAADLHRRLTEKTLTTVKAIAWRHHTEVEIRFEGGSESMMKQWLGPDTILLRQEPGGLGQRMQAAFQNAFQSGCRKVVLLGTDIPELKADHLEDALNALMDQDLVLGPSTDGGYWLMGLRRPANVFHGIKWGTEEVLDQTISLAKEQGLSVHLIDPLTDLDTEEDLRGWRHDKQGLTPYLSVIIPTLNEAANIEAAIHSAKDDDAEVIVVDGGSTDDTVARALNTGVRVELCQKGRAVQQNRGTTVARGSVLLFLHADTRLPGGFVSHIFEALMEPCTLAGAFRFKSDLRHPGMKLIEFLINFRARFLGLPYGDQCLFIRRKVFESLGGFPEVPIAEDLFLVRRISKLGRIRIAPTHVLTSARRWRTLGLFRTTLINQIIVVGIYLGVSPHTLASFYRAKLRH